LQYRLDFAHEPIVTLCGHLTYTCTYKWLHATPQWFLSMALQYCYSIYCYYTGIPYTCYYTGIPYTCYYTGIPYTCYYTGIPYTCYYTVIILDPCHTTMVNLFE